mmetsp:Transcript_31265/g.74256  ORF Transcript_31265/g.74256 Transcript_31265/m.74256 type:complete len:209 (-) Transcript_31265:1638-2264(-)
MLLSDTCSTRPSHRRTSPRGTRSPSARPSPWRSRWSGRCSRGPRGTRCPTRTACTPPPAGLRTPSCTRSRRARRTRAGIRCSPDTPSRSGPGPGSRRWPRTRNTPRRLPSGTPPRTCSPQCRPCRSGRSSAGGTCSSCPACTTSPESTPRTARRRGRIARPCTRIASCTPTLPPSWTHPGMRHTSATRLRLTCPSSVRRGRARTPPRQ